MWLATILAKCSRTLKRSAETSASCFATRRHSLANLAQLARRRVVSGDCPISASVLLPDFGARQLYAERCQRKRPRTRPHYSLQDRHVGAWRGSYPEAWPLRCVAGIGVSNLAIEFFKRVKAAGFEGPRSPAGGAIGRHYAEHDSTKKARQSDLTSLPRSKFSAR